MKTGKYHFSRNWHEFDHQDQRYGLGSDTNKIILWCEQHFGPAPKWGAYPGAPDAWSRWYYTGFNFKFRDEADYAFFLLRWS
jgi:hypothetical protein